MNHRSFCKYISFITFITSSASALAQEKQLKDVNGCFILYDMKANKELVRYGDKQCQERFPACSTFKVPLALMAYDKGILKDETDLYKWDGTKYKIPGWNHDQTAASWMKESVVWYSQILTPKLGKETVEKYLTDFGYGNHDMSGGIKGAWLSTPAGGKDPYKNSLKLSADEQVQFFAKLFKGELKVSQHAVAMTKKITFLETSKNGFELNGKTGSGFPLNAAKQKLTLGWFAAHIQKGEQELIAVTMFTDKRKKPPYEYGGPFAKELTKSILSEKGYY